ncbi:MAG: hypothetical protein ACFWTM_02500 [Mitsuokella multacida]|jgi:hypothetical protein
MQETPDQITAIALPFKPEGSFALLNIQKLTNASRIISLPL